MLRDGPKIILHDRCINIVAQAIDLIMRDSVISRHRLINYLDHTLFDATVNYLVSDITQVMIREVSLSHLGRHISLVIQSM